MRPPPALATFAAEVAAGALIGALIDAAIRFWGAGPDAILGVAGAALLALAWGARAEGAWGAAAVVATAGLLGGAPILLPALVAGVGGARGGELLALAAAGAATLGAAPLRSPLRRAGPAGMGVAVLAGALVLAPIPPEALAAVYAGAGLLATAADPIQARLSGPRRAAGRAGPLVVLPMGAALGAWALVRAPLDPTPLPTLLGLGAGVLAAAWTRGRVAALLAVALTAAALALGKGGIEAQGARLGPHAGVWAALGLGTAAGAWCGALGVGRGAGAALLVAVGGVAMGLSRLDSSLGAAAAQVRVTLGPDAAARARHAERREAAVLRHASVGLGGAVALWQHDRRVYAELDGAVADPDTRTGTAERLAGTLAACTTAGRGLARVAGDDLGLATRALRAQGFLRLDVAVPSPAFARAQAAAVPELATAWVHPGVRLLTRPAGAVARVGDRADAVVEIARVGWSDARRGLPDAAGLAATRRSLAPGGVYVLALGSPTMDAPRFEGVLAAVAVAFPDATVWFPPDGADSALVVAPREPRTFAWEGFVRCLEADRATLRAWSLRAPEDLAGLLWAPVPGPGRRTVAPRDLPPEVGLPGPLPILDLDPGPFDPASRFSADAPADRLRERHAALTRFAEVLRAAASGQVSRSVDLARELSRTPGGARAVEPLVRPHLDRARAAMRRAAAEGEGSRAWAEAEAALSTARLVFPGYAETLCAEAELAERRGRVADASAKWQACLDADPRSLAALDGLARTRRAQGDLLGAEDALRDAVAAHGGVWTTHHNLGVFLLAVGRTDEAERALREAVVLQADSDRPIAAPDKVLARLYLATGRPALALASAERAVSMEGSAEARFLRGAARYELGQLDLAEADFLAALAADASYVLARGGLGQVQAARGQYALAAESFRAVLAADPDNAEARTNLARLEPLLQP